MLVFGGVQYNKDTVMVFKANLDFIPGCAYL